MPDSYNTRLDDFVHRVPISSLFLDPGSTCAVYGCYEEDTLDTNYEYFLIQNRTCQYTGISNYYKDSTRKKNIAIIEVPTQETSTTVSTQEVTTEGREESQCTLPGGKLIQLQSTCTCIY